MYYIYIYIAIFIYAHSYISANISLGIHNAFDWTYVGIISSIKYQSTQKLTWQQLCMFCILLTIYTWIHPSNTNTRIQLPPEANHKQSSKCGRYYQGCHLCPVYYELTIIQSLCMAALVWLQFHSNPLRSVDIWMVDSISFTSYILRLNGLCRISKHLRM